MISLFIVYAIVVIEEDKSCRLCIFKVRYLDYAVGSKVWLVKPLFAPRFFLEDKLDRKKREG